MMIVWVLNVTIASCTEPSCALTPNPTQNSVQDNDCAVRVSRAQLNPVSVAVFIFIVSMLVCAGVHCTCMRVNSLFRQDFAL